MGLVRRMRELQIEQCRHEKAHGDVKQIITADFKGVRLVASGDKLFSSPKWKNFPDFLGAYLHSLLRQTWGRAQVLLPFEQQHPIVQWRSLIAKSQAASEPDANGYYKADIGAAGAWFRLAYDLYLIQHNAELQNKLLRRIRDPNQFQGARFEAAVAAIMLAAGYELRFCDETGPGKHPEFIATNKFTSHTLAVEAKSKQWPGIMGFEKGNDTVVPKGYGIASLLKNAARKDTSEPLLIFVELNSPTVLPVEVLHSPAALEPLTEELRRAWENVQALKWPKGFPAIGVVFYNDAAVWNLEKATPSSQSSIWAAVMWADSCRHKFDARPLLMRITQACMQRTEIPVAFPKN